MSSKYQFLLACLLSCTIAEAQVRIDRSAEREYKAVVKRLAPGMSRISALNDSSSFAGIRNELAGLLGFGIWTTYKVDTLNMGDYTLGRSEVFVEDIDTATGRAIKIDKSDGDGENTYLPVPLVTLIKHDSLFVNFYMIDPEFELIITAKKVTAFYKDYRKRDSVFRTDTSQPKLDQIRLPLIINSYVLSDAVFKPGKIIYASIDMQTPPYFEDAFGFSTGFIKKRLRFHCVLQLRLKEKKDLNRG